MATEVVSLFVLGLDILFPYGLALGTAVAVLSLRILSGSVAAAVGAGRRGAWLFGYLVRVLLYGAALWLAARTGLVAAAGAAIGLLLPRGVMYVKYGLAPWARRKLKKEPPVRYETDTKSRVFIKEPSLVRYCRGRVYMTHRHYKKVKIAGESRQGQGQGEEREAQ